MDVTEKTLRVLCALALVLLAVTSQLNDFPNHVLREVSQPKVPDKLVTLGEGDLRLTVRLPHGGVKAGQQLQVELVAPPARRTMVGVDRYDSAWLDVPVAWQQGKGRATVTADAQGRARLRMWIQTPEHAEWREITVG
jgi:hypothetical protein